MIRSAIAGIGHYLPERIVPNKELESIMETTDEWIVQRSGIRERRYAAVGENTVDLAHEAARRALESCSLAAEELDLLVVATLSPDLMFPGTGVLLQDRLGIPPRAALDVRNQCSGFLYALDVADAYVRSGKARNVLVVGAELQSRFLDMTTRGRQMAVLFGDGAAAVVLQPASGDSAIIGSKLYAQGEFARELMLESPGTASGGSSSHAMIDEAKVYPHMNGKFVFKHAVTRMIEVTRELMKECTVTKEDIDLFIFHQANMRINQAVANELGLDASKIYSNIERVGNTSAASIPLALSEAVESGRAKPGSLVMLAAFGSGFTWGATLVRL